MKRFLFFSVLLVVAAGCNEIPTSVGPDLAQESGTTAVTGTSKNGATARPFKMSHSSFQLDWGITHTPELACGGSDIAGGAISGEGNFTHLGQSAVTLSAAWDIGNQIPPNQAQFVPTGPAGGPVAPVLSGNAYPYPFHFDPFTQQCGTTVSATGELTLTAANGDQLFGTVTGGETFRLDFMIPGDGIETFALIDIVGGAGRFQNATGSFVTHTITRFDYPSGKFVIDLAEVLPGGTIAY